MSGYDWNAGMSNNAVAAYEDGKLPLSKAVRVVAKRAGVTQKVARAACLDVGPCEWHHSSKFFNRVYFYSVDDVTERVLELIDPLCDRRLQADDVREYGGGWAQFAGQPCHMSRERLAEEFQLAASFRRWEAALRRIEAKND